MTRPRLPTRGTHLVSPATGLVTRDWRDFFDFLVSTLGWDTHKKVYRDLFAGFGSFLIGSETTDAPLGTIEVFQLASGGASAFDGCLMLPNDYKNGTAVFPYCVWITPDTNTGNVVMHSIVGFPTAKAGALGENQDEQIVDAAEALEDGVVTTRFSSISGTGLRKGVPLPFQIGREGGDPLDTYGSVTYLLGFGFKYQAEGLGTPEVFP